MTPPEQPLLVVLDVRATHCALPPLRWFYYLLFSRGASIVPAANCGRAFYVRFVLRAHAQAYNHTMDYSAHSFPTLGKTLLTPLSTIRNALPRLPVWNCLPYTWTPDARLCPTPTILPGQATLAPPRSHLTHGVRLPHTSVPYRCPATCGSTAGACFRGAGDVPFRCCSVFPPARPHRPPAYHSQKRAGSARQRTFTMPTSIFGPLWTYHNSRRKKRTTRVRVLQPSPTPGLRRGFVHLCPPCHQYFGFCDRTAPTARLMPPTPCPWHRLPLLRRFYSRRSSGCTTPQAGATCAHGVLHLPFVNAHTFLVWDYSVFLVSCLPTAAHQQACRFFL